MDTLANNPNNFGKSSSHSNTRFGGYLLISLAVLSLMSLASALNGDALQPNLFRDGDNVLTFILSNYTKECLWIVSSILMAYAALKVLLTENERA